jgi:uncharacterized protein (TIGR00251 family)
MKDWLEPTSAGICLTLYVQPGASKAGPSGTFDGLPKIRLRSRAREGAANEELVRLLSKALGVPRSSVSISSGSHSRRKRITVEGPTEDLSSQARELLG